MMIAASTHTAVATPTIVRGSNYEGFRLTNQLRNDIIIITKGGMINNEIL